MDKKKLIMGGVAVILIAGGVFLFTGKSSKGGIKLETAKVGAARSRIRLRPPVR